MRTISRCQGCCFCKLLRSHLPHARIKQIDTSRAEREPGVHLVLTGKDFPNEYGILPVSQDERPLCGELARFVGDPVAAVIATDELTAQEAVDLIDIEYEPLQTIASPEEALATPEPRLHEYSEEGNVHRPTELSIRRCRRGAGGKRSCVRGYLFSMRAIRICP